MIDRYKPVDYFCCDLNLWFYAKCLELVNVFSFMMEYGTGNTVLVVSNNLLV